MSAFNRLLGLVADIFTLDLSDFSQIISGESDSERQQLSIMGRPLRLMTNRITGINRGIAGIITEIGNNPLSADDINILYTIEQLSEKLRILLQSQHHNILDEDEDEVIDFDSRRRILPIVNMLNHFVDICKSITNLNQVTPPDIKAAAAERAAIAIADRRRAMAELHLGLERSEREMGSQIRRQDEVERVSLRAARAPANAAPGFAGVAPSPEYAPRSPDYPPPRSPDYPPPRSPDYPPSLQLNPHAESFAAAAAQPSIERVRNEDERVNFNRLILQHPNPSNEFVCPITQEIMFDPVVALDGRTYERKAIERWLEKNSNSPMTKEHINDKTLRTNWAIRSAIERFLDGSLVKDMVGDSVEMLMKKINDGNDEDKKINKKDALVLLGQNDFNAQKAYDAYMMAQGGRKGGTRRNLRKKPRNQRKRYTKKRK